jgi:hypothetical protein
MTIKNSTVTREQYDRLERDFDLVCRNHVEYSEYSRERRTQLESAIKARGLWITALATLSLVQSAVLILTNI